MKKLENKVCLITGAGSGMGRAMAILFAAEGAKVLAADIHEERLKSVSEEVIKAGGTISTVKADMGSETDIERMVQTAVNTYGTLDVLVNNAGIMDNFAPAAELDNATWERVMNVNLNGPFKAMRTALNIFLQKGSGNIINIASIGGLHGGKAGAAYTSSKFALIGLTRNTGYMYAKTGIRCNAIAPGAVQTNISESIDMSKITPLVNDRIMSGLATNPRTGEASEIASAALFLASSDSSFVNGEVLVVDGGWTAG